QGRWGETRDLMEKLLRDYPNHLAATEAYRWLVQYYASSEARHREQRSGIVAQGSVQPGSLAEAGDAAAAGPDVAAAAPAGNPVVRVASRQQAAAVGGAAGDGGWAKNSVETAKRLMRAAPLSGSDPTFQFPLAAAQRALGNVKDADRFYTTF